MVANAYETIIEALEKTTPGVSSKVTMETDLIKDEVIDSLDSMSFLFELEEIIGKKLDAIDENFTDFRMLRLVEIVAAA